MRRLLAVLAALLVAVPTSVAAAPSPNVPATTAPRSYIVTYTSGTNSGVEAARLRGAGYAVSHVYSHVFPGVAVQLPPAAAAALANNPNVARVEPDAVVTATATQSSAPWGLDRVDQRALPLSGSYNWTSDGSGVSVYIVDTGILTTHTQFTGRTRSGYSAISGGTSDCNGHGTHVSGTAAGSTYGIAKAATLVPVRVLDCSGSGTTSGVIAGLDWVAGDHVAGAPAVANMSLGGGASLSLDDAVRRVIADGVTVVVAAGNSNADACYSSPSRVSAAITVGATTGQDYRSSFSNYGSCVDIFAPGSSITSSWIGSDTATNTISGTSMATPHVVGAVARLLSITNSLTPAEVATAIVGAATTGVVLSAGTGSPNRLLYIDPADAASSSGGTTPTPTPSAAAPEAPYGVTATAGRKAASVSWKLGSDGGSALTGQTVRIYRSGAFWATLAVAASATSVRVTSLQAGVSYAFSVIATNAVGSSAESTVSNSVIPTR